MSAAAPIYHPGDSFTLWCEKSQGPLWLPLLQLQSFYLQTKAQPPVRTSCQKKFMAFPSSDLSEVGRALAWRPLSSQGPSIPLMPSRPSRALFAQNIPFPNPTIPQPSHLKPSIQKVSGPQCVCVSLSYSLSPPPSESLKGSERTSGQTRLLV